MTAYIFSQSYNMSFQAVNFSRKHCKYHSTSVANLTPLKNYEVLLNRNAIIIIKNSK